MFKDFANVWTIVGDARDLKRDKPLPCASPASASSSSATPAAQACALIDRCPHRGVALSLGRVGNGDIECPFHGWRFDGAGTNCDVPWNPDAKRENLSAVALPCREFGGLLWLYTGVDPNEEPSPSTRLRRPTASRCAHNRWSGRRIGRELWKTCSTVRICLLCTAARSAGTFQTCRRGQAGHDI